MNTHFSKQNIENMFSEKAFEEVKIKAFIDDFRESLISYFIGLLLFSVCNYYFWFYVAESFLEPLTFDGSRTVGLFGFCFSGFVAIGFVWFSIPILLNIKCSKVKFAYHEENDYIGGLLSLTTFFYHVFLLGLIFYIDSNTLDMSSFWQAIITDNADTFLSVTLCFCGAIALFFLYISNDEIEAIQESINFTNTKR